MLLPTQEAGGRIFDVGSPAEQAAAFTAVRNDLAHSYVLAYTPSSTENRGFRKIVVQIDGRSDYHIRTRAGYTIQ